VDKGHWQLETDLFNATHEHAAGVSIDTFLFTDPTLKLGVGDRTDVEVSFTPYEEIRTETESDGRSHTLAGSGDLTFSAKQNFFGDYRGPLALAVEPFITAPTGRSGIGDGGWAGGLLLPIAAGLGKSLVINLTPALRVEPDAQRRGVHLAPVEIINVAWSLPANLTLSTELYAREDQNPSGVVTQCSADFGGSLGLKNDLELDVGVNLGLNSQTAATQAYVGFAKRY
jgi:hypothetical protein